MSSKSMLLGTSCFISLITLGMGFVARFLLYRWVHVPDYLWILFWADVPFTMSLATVGEVLKRAASKED